MRLRELLETEGLGLTLLVDGGEATSDTALDRIVRAVPTVDLADPGRFLTGGELVLSELAWWHRDGDAEAFVRALGRAGVTALAAGEAAHGRVPDDLVHACRRHGLPLVAVHPDTPFTAVTEHVLHRLRPRPAGDLAAVLERHRRLLTDRSAPDSVLELLRQDLGIGVRVLSVTGRQIAGARPPLHTATAAALSGRYLAARRAGEPAPHRVTVGDRSCTLLPVRAPGTGSAGSAPGAELGDWLMAVEADVTERPPSDGELLARVTELMADARRAHDQAKAALSDLAHRLLDLLHGSVPPEEIPVRLSSTAQAIVSRTFTWPRCQFVVARAEWQAQRPVPAPALRALLEEALIHPDGPAPVSAEDIAATVDGDQAVLFVLVPERADGLPAPALDCAALQRRLTAVLGRWLGPDGRLSVGVGTPVAEPGNARGALEEARTALRLASETPDRVTVRGPDHLTSGILSLLPLIPAATRGAFAARLLGPLRDHDARHRTDLLPTLETFLACDASWTACAAELHLHTNSLRHRIARIEQLTGRDLSRLETRLDFLAALGCG
ncbi:PucR family transcriptional regulator [Streptomyces sp. NPDC101118]|uniref:PucR family transcriptional regulator n=1 Tax=Streptomyces sp. NPDC101118 TaxID=3366109 RepID=UPI0038088AD2